MIKNIVQIIAPFYNWSDNINIAKIHVDKLRTTLMGISDINILIADDYYIYYDEISDTNLLIISIYSNSDIRKFLINYFNNIFSNEKSYSYFKNYFNNKWEFHSENFAHIIELYIKEKNINSLETIKHLFWFLIYSQNMNMEINI